MENSYKLPEPDPGVKPGGKKAKRKLERALTEYELDFPALAPKVGIEKTPKYVVISTPEGFKPLGKFNQFLVKKYVDGASTLYSKPSFLRDGTLLLLLCNSVAIAEKFMALKTLGDIKVVVKYHDRLNSVQGSVYSRNLVHLSEDEILEGLKGQGVTKVVKMTRPDNGTRVPSGLFLLTFDRFNLPKEIEAGFEKLQVREYLPNPMRCRKCQMLGHTEKRCPQEKATCGTCGKELPHTNCPGPYCVNCKSNTHASSDRNCPEYLIKKEVLLIMSRKRISMYEAKKEFYSSGHPLIQKKNGLRTSAQVVKETQPIATTTLASALASAMTASSTMQVTSSTNPPALINNQQNTTTPSSSKTHSKTNTTTLEPLAQRKPEKPTNQITITNNIPQTNTNTKKTNTVTITSDPAATVPAGPTETPTAIKKNLRHKPDPRPIAIEESSSDDGMVGIDESF